jgi:hypothetical protein
MSHYDDILDRFRSEMAVLAIEPNFSILASPSITWAHPAVIPPPPPVSPMSNRFTESNMQSMLQYRMGWNMNAPKCELTSYRAHKLNDEAAVVFIIHRGKAIMIEDDLQLYPSDALVTQLRLLEAS